MRTRQPDRRTRNGSAALRLVFWLLAAVSFGDFVPAAGEFWRAAGTRTADGWPGASYPLLRDLGDTHVAVAGKDQPLPDGLPAAESAVDHDSARAPTPLPSRGWKTAPAGIVSAQLPDGQPPAAFNSRAPPISA